MMLNPFDDVEEEEDDEDFADEEPLLVLRCNLMAQKKPCCYNGKCVRLEEGSLEMVVCKYFIIVDATEEDLKNLEIVEEN
jgi:hypothetical protein